MKFAVVVFIAGVCVGAFFALMMAQDQTSAQKTGKTTCNAPLCRPITVPLASRIYFPHLALRLRALVDSGRPTIRWVEIGARGCPFTWEVISMFYGLSPDINLTTYVVDSWG